MRVLLYGTVMLAITGAVACAGPTITFDQDYTAVNGQEYQDAAGTSTILQPIPNPPVFLPFDQTTTIFSQNYMQPSGTYDWGAEAQGEAVIGDGNSVATSANAYTTINGDGTNQYRVRFSSEILLNSVAPLPSGFNGNATGTEQSYQFIVIGGLTPGQSYTMHYDWDVDYSAGLAHSNGSSYALGLMQAYVGTIIPDDFIPYTTMFETGLQSGEPGEPPPDHTESGLGDMPFVATSAFMDFEVVTQSVVSGSFDSPLDSETDDLEGATFFGEATYSVQGAPEPSVLGLLACGGLALSRRR